MEERYRMSFIDVKIHQSERKNKRRDVDASVLKWQYTRTVRPNENKLYGIKILSKLRIKEKGLVS